MSTVTLKLNCSCDGCVKRIHKTVSKTKGQNFHSQSLITIKFCVFGIDFVQNLFDCDVESCFNGVKCM